MLNPASCRAVDEESPAGTTRRYPGLRSAALRRTHCLSIPFCYLSCTMCSQPVEHRSYLQGRSLQRIELRLWLALCGRPDRGPSAVHPARNYNA